MHAFQPSVAVALKRGFDVARHAVTSKSGRSSSSPSGSTLVLAKVLVSISLLAWLIWEVEPAVLLSGLLKVSVASASLVVGLSVFQNILLSIRWNRILKMLGSVLSSLVILRLTFIGFFSVKYCRRRLVVMLLEFTMR